MRANPISSPIRAGAEPDQSAASRSIRHSNSISSSIGSPLAPINGMPGFRRRASVTAPRWIARSREPAAR
jgi:hypothetical protein